MALFSWCDGQSRQPHKQDGPWSVLVLVCTFLQAWLFVGIVRGFGVYLPVLMSEFNEGRDKIALVGSLAIGLAFFLTVVVTWLNSFIDSRIICGVRHLSLIIAFTVSSTVRRVELMYFTYSIFLAIGISFNMATHVLVIVKYFKKHRSLALGVNSSGGALGIMTVPNIIQYLLDSVEWRNTFRIQAAVVVTSCFLCLVFSPNVENETTHGVRDNAVSPDNSNNAHILDANEEQIVVLDSQTTEKHCCSSHKIQIENQTQLTNGHQSGHFLNINKERDTEEEERSFGENMDEKARVKSSEDEPKQQIPKKKSDFDEFTTQQDNQIVGHKTEAKGKIQKVASLRGIFDLSVWKVPTYAMAVISCCVASFAIFSNSVHLVKFSEEKAGLSGRRATTLYIFLGLASLIARIGAGKLCDIKCIKPSMVNMAAEILGAINTFLLTLSANYTHLAILTFVHGLADGMFRTTCIVLFTTSVERSKSGSAFGQGNFLIAPFNIAGPAITGLLADVFNGYNEAYYLNGCVLIAVAAVYLIPALLRLCKGSRTLTLEQIEMSTVHCNGIARDEANVFKTSKKRERDSHLPNPTSFNEKAKHVKVKFSEEKAGLSGRSATTLYIFIGLTSLTAQIFSGKLCDIACIKPSMVHMTSELLAAINMYLLTLSKNYLHLAILTCMYGLADGMFRTTSTVLLTTSVPRSKTASAYGQGNSLAAPFIVAGPAITGLLADVYNGYTEAYYVNGFVLMAAAAVHLTPTLLRLRPTSSNDTLEQIEMAAASDKKKPQNIPVDIQISKTNPCNDCK